MTPNFEKEKLVWKSEYNVGNEQLDGEHQKLFALAKESLKLTSLDNKEQKDKLKDIIEELQDYTEQHFYSEEKFMERIKYPHLEEHSKLHEAMLKILKEITKELKSLELKDIQDKLCVFIEEYFVRHIIMEDKKIHLWNTPLEDVRKNFGWKNVYSINNIKIDQEHKEL